jgi:hypothetical protein
VQNAEFLYVKAGGKYSNHFAWHFHGMRDFEVSKALKISVCDLLGCDTV